jgi:3-hydroxyisobutyrate dehydrogenase
MSENKPRIAFFGLGIMGIGMARRLLGAGYELTVYNRNASKAQPLASEGAKVAASPRDAAKGAGVLIAMLADDNASRAVWLGNNGVLAAAEKGAVALDCSTITVEWARELAGEAAKHGVALLDAPVTGTKPHAAKGELTFLVGGDASTLEKVRPVLQPMSNQIVHVGPTGSGAALKLINNYICGIQAAGLAEGVAMLQRAGLNVETALPVLANGSPGSPLVKTLATRFSSNDPTVNFLLRLMAKDMKYGVGLAEENGVDPVAGKVALETFNAAVDADYGEQDFSAVIRYVQSRQAGRG